MGLVGSLGDGKALEDASRSLLKPNGVNEPTVGMDPHLCSSNPVSSA